MTQFGMSEADINKLKEGRRKRNFPAVPLSTVGDVARYTAGDPNNPGAARPLTDFDGIGPQIADRIADHLTAFHGWWAATGRAEFARELGVDIGSVDPVEPGAAVAGDGGEDPGQRDEQRGSEPVGDPAGDDGGIATADELAAFVRDRDAARAAQAEPFVEPAGAGDTFSLGDPPAG
jgi:hypothetical protein